MSDLVDSAIAQKAMNDIGQNIDRVMQCVREAHNAGWDDLVAVVMDEGEPRRYVGCGPRGEMLNAIGHLLRAEILSRLQEHAGERCIWILWTGPAARELTLVRAELSTGASVLGFDTSKLTTSIVGQA